MKGYIFNIQKFCLHDGPGIRTTVFFKGCNLRCSWCANPESQAMEAQITLDQSKCTLCGRCISACNAGARRMENGRIAVDADGCSACGMCMEACDARAIGREGQAMDLEEVLFEVMKDKPFYDQSGGGVTFSGGEALLQMEFAAALADALHERGVSVALETAGAVAPEAFRAFLEKLDFVHIDLKHHDDAAHRRGTGLGNETILKNIRTLQKSGKAFVVRIPVIPGYNDALEDARGFAQLLDSMGIGEVQLLPFHQLGEKKYSLLGRDYAFGGVAQLHSEDLKEYIQEFSNCGIQARI